jgi:hypothetical protein
MSHDNDFGKKMRTPVDRGSQTLWFLGFVGALVYYLRYHSGTFTLVLIAIFKAIVWPAYLVYYLLRFLRV